MTRRLLLSLPFIGTLARAVGVKAEPCGGAIVVGPGNGNSVMLIKGMTAEWFNADLSKCRTVRITAIDYERKTVTFE